MFAYCGNNPTNSIDPNGEFFFTAILIGAAVGALISGGCSAVSQGVEKGFDNIDWGVVGVNTLTGAISGALAATPISTIASVGVNAGLGLANYLGEQAVKGEEVTVGGAVLNTIAGGFSGLVSGGGLDSEGLRDSWKYATNGLAREARRQNTKYAMKQTAMYTAKKLAIKQDVATTVVRFFGGVVGSYALKHRINRSVQ